MSTITAASPTGRHYIAGEWRTPKNPSLESHNPAHWDEVVGVFPAATGAEVEQAVRSAREAFPPWRRTSPIPITFWACCVISRAEARRLWS